MIDRALPLALADLKVRYGADMSKWRWGDAHPAVSDHRPSGRQPWLCECFNISVPTAGDNYTVNVGSFRIGNDATPYASRHAASLRAIYDLADLNRSVYMHSTGQSGNLLSPYYSNFSTPLAQIENIPMTTNRSEIEAGQSTSLISWQPAKFPPARRARRHGWWECGNSPLPWMPGATSR
jgi:penicillin G amidase